LTLLTGYQLRKLIILALGNPCLAGAAEIPRLGQGFGQSVARWDSGVVCCSRAFVLGRIQRCETWFWLEVGEEHKDEEHIATNIGKRLRQAIQLLSGRV